MNDLHTLLRASVENAPLDDFDADDLVRSGRRRVRRRRVGIMATCAAIVAILIAVPLTMTRGGDPSHAPAAPTSTVQDVLTLDGAPVAVEGRDYTPVATVPSLPAHSTVVGVSGDRLVVSADPHGDEASARMGVLTLRTGHVKWIEGLSGPYLGSTGTTLVFGGAEEGASFQTYDLASGRVTPLTGDHSLDGEWAGSNQSQMVTDDKVYLAQGPAADEPTRALFGLDIGGQRWQHLADVGAYAVDGDTLVSTARVNMPPGRVTVRAPLTGRSTTFDPRSPRGCDAKKLALTSNRIFLGLLCGTKDEGDSVMSRIDVFDLAGKRIRTIAGKNMGMGDGNFGTLTVTTGSASYYYSAHDRLLRLPKSSGDGAAYGDGSFIAWQTDRGWRVAQLS